MRKPGALLRAAPPAPYLSVLSVPNPESREWGLRKSTISTPISQTRRRKQRWPYPPGGQASLRPNAQLAQPQSGANPRGAQTDCGVPHRPADARLDRGSPACHRRPDWPVAGMQPGRRWSTNGGSGGDVPRWRVSGNPGKPLPRGPQNAFLSPIPRSALSQTGHSRSAKGARLVFLSPVPIHRSLFPPGGPSTRSPLPSTRGNLNSQEAPFTCLAEGFRNPVGRDETPDVETFQRERGVGFGGAGGRRQVHVRDRCWQLVWGGASPPSIPPREAGCADWPPRKREWRQPDCLACGLYEAGRTGAALYPAPGAGGSRRRRPSVRTLGL